MTTILGIYHGKKPVLEIRKGTVPLWKSPGWTTPNTSVGLAATVPLINSTGSVVKLWGDKFAQNTSDDGSGHDGSGWTAYNDRFSPSESITLPNASLRSMTAVDASKKFLVWSTSYYNGNGLAAIFSTSDLSKTIGTIKGEHFFDQVAAGTDGALYLRVANAGNLYQSNKGFRYKGGSLTEVGTSDSPTIGLSFYNGFYYSLHAGSTTVTVTKLDQNFNPVSTANPPALGTNLPPTDDFTTHAAAFDAAGAIFTITKTDSNFYLSKATTDGKLFAVAINSLSYPQLYTDGIGNAYIIDTVNTADGNGNITVRVQKFSNNLTPKWTKNLGYGVGTSNCFVGDSGNIYVQRATASGKTKRVLDVYQQTSI